MVLCSVVIPITRDRLTSKKIGILNFITFAILILESEIQINGSVPFWEISTWFATVIFLIFCAFFFLGRPRDYLIFLISYLTYYYARTLFFIGELFEHDQNIEIISCYLYIFSTALLSFLLNIYWFRVRYTNLKNNHLTKVNQVRVVAMERNVAALQERENIFMDIHDHLGGKILECYLSLGELIEIQKFDDKQIISIQDKLLQVRYSIRNRMRTIEEIDLISDNLFLGLQFLINSRYQNANKKLNLIFSDKFTEDLKSFKPSPLYVRNIYFFISELINNDLQYGIREAKWRFDSVDWNLHISLSNFIQKQEFEGMGTQNILQRINILNGTYDHSINIDGQFNATIVIPFSLQENSDSPKIESTINC
ncbi:hypothetical protein [Leptospira sp. GIMC2001]|uniref:hypothetical protein n=1 Tax=Leptospira sp. GIMC2001 TaxID=1513297 RepID=UPI002349BB66|nr:hypothetical protein [Leptospira sp. GIMC2001]WCL49624.1 hypothetical protein O4O04_02060 [Leptospira sp. GIMC2001]